MVMDGGIAVSSLSREQCLALLSTTTAGQVGVSIAALPEIRPVRFRLVSNRVVFRLPADSDLWRAAAGKVVAFQADGFDDKTGTGWNVHGQGWCQPIRSHDFADRLRAMMPGGGADDDPVLRLSLDSVAGNHTARDSSAQMVLELAEHEPVPEWCIDLRAIALPLAYSAA